MQITEEQAAALISNVAVASIHHDEDLALLDEGQSAYAALDWALEPLQGAGLTDDERDELRVRCGRAIVDPTTFRGQFLEYVLSAVPDAE